MVSAKLFVAAAGDEEEVILLPVKVIAKAKPTFPLLMLDLVAALSVAMSGGRREQSAGSLQSPLLAPWRPCQASSHCSDFNDLLL